MIKHIFHILVFVFLVSCSKDAELPAGLRAEGFKLVDAKHQELILNQMAELSIPFIIDERGFVRYMQRDVAEVRGLMRRARYGDDLSHKVIESSIIIDATHKKLLVSKFEKADIPYNLDSSNGYEHINWLQIYAPQVDLIIQEVGFEHFEQATNK